MSISDAQFATWLQQDSTNRVLLVEAVYYSSGTEHTVYLSDGIFISTPADTPENMPYDDTILALPQFKSALSDALEGFTVPSWGDISISNELFDKDNWLNYAWDGRAVTLLYGDGTWARSDFRVILTGTVAALSADTVSTLKMSIRDKQWMLNVPIQPRLIGEPVLVSGTTYKVSDSAVTSIDAVWDMGNLLTLTSQYTVNVSSGRFTLVSAPSGRVTASFTDTSTAAKSNVIPLCYGQCFNVTPAQINSSLLKYQVHDGQINAITDVRDNGVSVGFTADLTHGTFILTSSPVGTVTADVQGAKPAGTYLTKSGDIINHIVTVHTSLTSSDVSASSLSAFVATCTQTIGLYIPDRQNVIDVLDQIVTSVGAWYTFNRSGQMIFGRMDVPSGTPVMHLVSDDIVFGGLSIQNMTVPVMTERISFFQNWTQQTTVAGSVSVINATLFSQAAQWAACNNQQIKVTHLMATEPAEKETFIVSAAEAVSESVRLLSLWGAVRRTYQAECIVAPLTLNLGDVISLDHPRYGLSGGVSLRIIGISESVTTRRVTLTLWG